MAYRLLSLRDVQIVIDQKTPMHCMGVLAVLDESEKQNSMLAIDYNAFGY